MTQVKELHTERHTQMSFIEFIEAIARVAYRLQEFPEHLLPVRYRRRSAMRASYSKYYIFKNEIHITLI